MVTHDTAGDQATNSATTPNILLRLLRLYIPAVLDYKGYYNPRKNHFRCFRCC
jgi:hypothetical protein